MQIQIPSHAIPISFVKALEKYDQGKKILAVLSDVKGVYAAQAYLKDWTNLDKRTKEFKKFREQGQWFLLSQ
ncbi:hypothetical protein ACFLFF_31670 [Brevibacillus reuszeri]|uniref:hypothetical protein n=1 Tax=Brevibacillus reuszeri TaxID=54915 RepID=UPI00366B62B3